MTINVLLVYLYGLSLHVFYVLSKGLKITDFLITGKNGEISSSIIWHTHIAKGVIGQILFLFDKSKLPTIDAGGSYVGTIPAYIFFFGAALILFLIFQVLYFFVSSFRSMLIVKNTRQKIFFFIGYSIISFSIIKTSIDGGLFNLGFWLSSIFLIFFVLRERLKFSINFSYLITFILLIVFSIGLYIDFFTRYNSLTIVSIATLFALYTTIYYLTEDKPRITFIFLLTFLFLSTWWFMSLRDIDMYNYSKTIIDKKQKIYVYNEKSNIIQSLDIKEPETVKKLANELGKNITYLPVSIPGFTCLENDLPSQFSVSLLSKDKITKNLFTTSEFITIKNEDSIKRGNIWKTSLNLSINPCTPEPLSAINGEILKSGIKEYILVNPTPYASSND